MWLHVRQHKLPFEQRKTTLISFCLVSDSFQVPCTGFLEDLRDEFAASFQWFPVAVVCEKHS